MDTVQKYEPPSSGGKTRSPAYPLIDLEKAIDCAKKLYDHAKLHEVNKAAVGESWKMSHLSGTFLGYVAALKTFGLVASSGAKEQLKYKLTKDSERIILDQTNSPEKKEAIQRAAMAPKIYQELWEKFGKDGVDGSVEASVLSNYLILDRPGPRYNPTAAKLVIKHYKSTLAFAGVLDNGQTTTDEDHQQPEDPNEIKKEPEPENPSPQGEYELTRGTFSQDSGFRLMLRGKDRTPRHFKVMIAQILLHADFFGVVDPKILRLADAIIPSEVIPPE